MTTTPTNPQESEPREFWISEHRKGRNISNRIDIFTAVESEPENPGWLHVIEFAAYSKLKAELTQANIAFEQIEKMNEYVCKQRDELKAELAEAKQTAELTEREITRIRKLGGIDHRIYEDVVKQLTQQSELIAECEKAITESKPYIDELIDAATYTPPPLSLKVICSLVPLNTALDKIKNWKAGR